MSKTPVPDEQLPDEQLIERCFELAKKALGNTSPNPLVGSVIVKNGKIIAEGFHLKSGLPHAEKDALTKAKEDVKGATLYCNLEPCCHTNKKTPPCTQAIIDAGIKKVVISNLDPNPFVAGQGVEILRAAGIEVETGICEEKGRILNEVFFTHITKKRPFVHLKWAQTIDGKIATQTYHSKWITSEVARSYVHRERNLYDAIAVGAKTANKDNPSLTIRLSGKEEKCKARIIFQGETKINPKLKVLTDQFKEQTIIVSQKNLTQAMKSLYQQGICSIYVEGGAKLISSFIEKGLVDRLSVYIAPKLLGPGLSSFSTKAVDKMEQAHFFDNGCWTQIGPDVVFESRRNLCLQD